MIATIIAWFTRAALLKIGGKLWTGFCQFIATPIGAAVVAGLVMFVVGTAHEHHKLNAAWQAKWAAAEQQAEQDRIARDASIKVKMQADAALRTAALQSRAAELEQKVKAYEDEENKKAAAGKLGCYTDGVDAQWLRDVQRKRAKPEAHRGFAVRLRAVGGGSPGAGH